MLIQFRFKNYKSFRDEAILDLSSTKITENAENVVQVGKEKILKMAAIYGANASGKSGIFDAFEYMSYYVIQSFTFDDEISEKQRSSPNRFLCFQAAAGISILSGYDQNCVHRYPRR